MKLQYLRQYSIGAKIDFFKTPQNRDFPSNPVVKTSPSNVRGGGSIPGQGAKIPHALWPKTQNIKKQKQYCNKFNKPLKMVHIKKKKKQKKD